MVEYNIFYYLLTISTLVLLFFLLFLIRISKKKHIHYAFISLIAFTLLWNFSLLIYLTVKFMPYRWYFVFYEMGFWLGVIGTMYSVYLVGYIYANSMFSFKGIHKYLMALLILDVILFFTNPLHHMFYSHFSDMPIEMQRGIFWSIHCGISYLFLFLGMGNLLVFSVRNSGFFSRQSILIFIGLLVPIAVDSISTFTIITWWPFTVENIAFSFSVACFIMAIVKFKLLNVIPVAIQTVVDLISDSYVVINEDYEIIDYNKTFVDLFEGVISFKRKDDFIELLKKSGLGLDHNKFLNIAKEALINQETQNFEFQIKAKNIDKYFIAEIIPIFTKNQLLGVIVLLKDITEHKQNLIQVNLLNEKLKELVNRDGLTRTYNRYFFDERLQQEIDRVTKQQTYGQDIYKTVDDFGLIIFDIDFFKHYNDNNGHLAGDELLQELVIVVKSALFPTDILCRYGGEEFAIICCKTSIEGVAIVAEKVRAAVEEYKFRFQDSQPNGNLTISLGVAYCNSPEMDKETLIRTADQRLYKAKDRGRNRVVFTD